MNPLLCLLQTSLKVLDFLLDGIEIIDNYFARYLSGRRKKHSQEEFNANCFKGIEIDVFLESMKEDTGTLLQYSSKSRSISKKLPISSQ